MSSIDDCAKAGIKSLMVVASGFAEAGEEGRALQEELKAKALKHKLPLLGPNNTFWSYGITNPDVQLVNQYMDPTPIYSG